MTGRSYGEYCPVAQTLDAVGDRWALLVVRELLWGPQRFTDLQGRLPGIGTNQLATRLRELEGDGLVSRRVLPPPAASTVYELTTDGWRLEPVIAALARFGLPRLHATSPVNTFRPAWAAVTLRALVGSGTRPDREWRWEIRVEGEVFHVCASPTGSTARPGPDPDAAAVITTDTITAFALAGGELTVEEARRRNLLQATDDAACVAWARDSGLGQRVASASASDSS